MRRRSQSVGEPIVVAAYSLPHTPIPLRVVLLSETLSIMWFGVKIRTQGQSRERRMSSALQGA